MPRANSESDFGGSMTSDNDSDVDAGPSSPIGPGVSQPTGETFELPTPAAPKSNPKSNDEQNNLVSHNSTSNPTSPTLMSIPSHSTRIPTTTDTNNVSAGSTLTGAARFRASARRMMQMHRTSSTLVGLRGVGAEPGIDPRRASAIAAYGHVRENCAIEVVDYSSVRSKFLSYNNKQFVEFLETNGTKREPWVKVRWISIGGISWDVISTLALTYDLHPLSLEDVLHRRGHIRSKADYFSRHLFLRVLCHALGNPDEMDNLKANVYTKPTQVTKLPRSSSPANILENDSDTGSSEKNTSRLFQRKNIGVGGRKPTARDLESGTHQGAHRSDSRVEAQARATVDKLKEGERVNVELRNLFIFLLRDGTLVSLHQTPTSEFFKPIMSRLRTPDTVLRMTADPSILVQSLLDLVVDQAMEVVEEYQRKILKLEHDILLKPNVVSVRQLHILSGDLTLHKRTLDPLKSLVYGLRRYDLDRCVAVAASFAGDSPDADATDRKVVGYMSHKAKVYLADVHDHVDYILNSLDMFASISENLINYTFNMASYEMNQVMRRLTLATIIFLPLTLLTGYFGMNFPMWSVDNNSDALFWKIAIPLMVPVIVGFMWTDIVSAKHFAQKKTDIKRITHRMG